MSAITSATSGSSRAASSTSAFDSLTSEQFIKVMFAELTNQDPSQPSSSKDLLQQIGTIRSIESDLTLQKRLTDLTRQNEITAAGSLIGKFARGLDDSGTKAEGFVDSVSVTREGSILNLSTNRRIALSRLEQVIDPALVQGVPPGTGGRAAPGTGAAPRASSAVNAPGGVAAETGGNKARSARTGSIDQ